VTLIAPMFHPEIIVLVLRILQDMMSNYGGDNVIEEIYKSLNPPNQEDKPIEQLFLVSIPI
jgi:hypothetical protein